MSSDSEEWTVCVNVKKQKRDAKRAHPHLIQYGKAQALQRKLNIDNLANTLLSAHAHDIQCAGWIYSRVLRPGDPIPEDNTDTKYTTLPVNNEWGDLLLFRIRIEDKLSLENRVQVLEDHMKGLLTGCPNAETDKCICPDIDRPTNESCGHPECIHN